MKQQLFAQEIELMRTNGIEPDDRVAKTFNRYCEALSDAGHDRFDDSDRFKVERAQREIRQLFEEQGFLFDLIFPHQAAKDLKDAIDLYNSTNENLHYIPIILYHLNQALLTLGNAVKNKYLHLIYQFKKRITQILEKLDINEFPEFEITDSEIIKKIEYPLLVALKSLQQTKLFGKFKMMEIVLASTQFDMGDDAEFTLTISEQKDYFSPDYLHHNKAIILAAGSGSSGIARPRDLNGLARIHVVKKNGDPFSVDAEEKVFQQYDSVEDCIKGISTALKAHSPDEKIPANPYDRFKALYQMDLQLGDYTIQAYFDRPDSIRHIRILQKPTS